MGETRLIKFSCSTECYFQLSRTDTAEIRRCLDYAKPSSITAFCQQESPHRMNHARENNDAQHSKSAEEVWAAKIYLRFASHSFTPTERHLSIRSQFPPRARKMLESYIYHTTSTIQTLNHSVHSRSLTAHRSKQLFLPSSPNLNHSINHPPTAYRNKARL